MWSWLSRWVSLMGWIVRSGQVVFRALREGREGRVTGAKRT
jgi:hypothetical protein